MNPDWLDFAQRIKAIAQSGLAFSTDEFDRERYQELTEIAVRMMSSYTEKPPEVIRELIDGEVGYATPKVDVRAGIFADGRILLVKEKMDGKWTLPGGWADVGFTPSEAAVKEAEEETGFKVRPTKLALVHDNSRHHPPAPFRIYKLMFVCEIISGEPDPDHEIDEVAFFGPNELPDLSATRINREQILRLFEHQRDPTLHTDFD